MNLPLLEGRRDLIALCDSIKGMNKLDRDDLSVIKGCLGLRGHSDISFLEKNYNFLYENVDMWNG